MKTRPQTTTEDLRRAIDCLPAQTKMAMLQGIRANEIIVGAYTDGNGICPMLAAHRAGGRTSLISFARAWDRFAFRDARSGRVRRASERELTVLTAHLQASLLGESARAGELAEAIAEHLKLVAGRQARSEAQTVPSRQPPCAARVSARPRRLSAGARRAVRRTRTAILSM